MMEKVRSWLLGIQLQGALQLTLGGSPMLHSLATNSWSKVTDQLPTVAVKPGKHEVANAHL
jgi:hypothetical protein